MFSLKVFRSQLPKDNPYWPPLNEDEEKLNDNKDHGALDKFVAGW